MFDITGQNNTTKDDYQRFLVPDGKVDPDFSPARNKAIIEQSIKDYDAMRAKKARAQDEPYEERASAVMSYLNSRIVSSGGQNSLEKYFGKRMLAYLRGQEIRDRLMADMHVVDKNGIMIR